MEAEMMSSSLGSGRSALEGEAYWRHHTEVHGSSGLTKRDYCIRYQVHYHRFIYWSRKLEGVQAHQLPVKGLVSVQLKEESRLPMASSPILCSLVLRQGLSIQIHDEQALGIILERVI